MKNIITTQESSIISLNYLWVPWGNCGICNKAILLDYALPMWCGEIVPDELLDSIEWAGIPVCKDCYQNPPKDRFLKISCQQGNCIHG
jgi:hypothetical protein